VVTTTAFLTSFMTQKRLRIEQQLVRRLQLQGYLNQERVEHALAMAIKRQVLARAAEKTSTKARDVADLALISHNLRQELAVWVHGALLRGNSFFSVCEAVDQNAFVAICSACTAHSFRAEDQVWEEGSSGDGMMFVKTGSLKYAPGPRSKEATWTQGPTTLDRLRLTRGQWCSEAALWCEWTYLGTMVAIENSELVVLKPEGLLVNLKRHTEVQQVALEFAISLVKCYQQDAATSGKNWSDLELGLDHADVISNTPREARILVADSLLDFMQQRDQWGFVRRATPDHACLSKLREEVQSGVSFVSRHQEEIFRTVFIVALRLRRRSDWSLLAKIGEVAADGQVIKASCQLPGTKRKEQEAAVNALQRFLAQDMPQLRTAVRVSLDNAEHSDSMQHSGQYGIRSRYIKTTFDVEMDDCDRILPTMSANLAPVQLMPTGHKTSTTSGTPSEDGHYDKGGFKCQSPFDMWRSCIRKKKPDSGRRAGRLSYTSRKAESNRNFLGILSEVREVVMLPRADGGKHVYIWVSDADYQTLQSPQAPAAMSQFLKETQKQWIQMDAERTFMGQLSSQSGMIEIDASDGCSSSNTTAQVSQI